ncbi:BolA/IbaG family iron-sulfur metabolism protein [Buchnera aphidicola]|uniref:BolA/IbaG family iron-sulfur metabolism protein n=1 Tax=Buchnera aphidicola TaxID=9 RepID=UPI0034648795
MNIQKIQFLLIKKLNLKTAYVTGDQNHINIIAIGDIFKGVSPVKKQKMIYTLLIEMITQKKIHAISIESYSIEEWNKKNNIQNDKNTLLFS